MVIANLYVVALTLASPLAVATPDVPQKRAKVQILSQLDRPVLHGSEKLGTLHDLYIDRVTNRVVFATFVGPKSKDVYPVPIERVTVTNAAKKKPQVGIDLPKDWREKAPRFAAAQLRIDDPAVRAKIQKYYGRSTPPSPTGAAPALPLLSLRSLTNSPVHDVEGRKLGRLAEVATVGWSVVSISVADSDAKNTVIPWRQIQPKRQGTGWTLIVGKGDLAPVDPPKSITPRR